MELKDERSGLSNNLVEMTKRLKQSEETTRVHNPETKHQQARTVKSHQEHDIKTVPAEWQ